MHCILILNLCRFVSVPSWYTVNIQCALSVKACAVRDLRFVHPFVTILHLFCKMHTKRLLHCVLISQRMQKKAIRKNRGRIRKKAWNYESRLCSWFHANQFKIWIQITGINHIENLFATSNSCSILSFDYDFHKINAHQILILWKDSNSSFKFPFFNDLNIRNAHHHDSIFRNCFELKFSL